MMYDQYLDIIIKFYHISCFCRYSCCVSYSGNNLKIILKYGNIDPFGIVNIILVLLDWSVRSYLVNLMK